MKIVKVKGGLGNQLFQYAFALVLRNHSREEVKLDLSQYGKPGENKMPIPWIMELKGSIPIASKKEISEVLAFRHSGDPFTVKYRLGIAAEAMLNPKYYFEKDRAFRDVDALRKYRYFDGYWQSYRYVNEVRGEMEDIVFPKAGISDVTQEMIQQVSHEESVFVGVRRGDYQKEASHYGSFGSEYFEKAMKYLEEHVVHPVYYVFSNDVEWSKKEIRWGDRQVYFREPNQQVSDLEEFFLMKSCRHGIVMNSTFHWWAAYLMNDPDKIIVRPEKWFFDNKKIDIYPSDWISL